MWSMLPFWSSTDSDCVCRREVLGWRTVHVMTVWKQRWEQWYLPLGLFARLSMTQNVSRSGPLHFPEMYLNLKWLHSFKYDRLVYLFIYMNICVNRILCINVCVNALELFEWSFQINFVFSCLSAERWCSSELRRWLLQDMWVSTFIWRFWSNALSCQFGGVSALLPGSGWAYWLNNWWCGLL